MLLLLRQLPYVISRIVILMEKNTIEDDWLSPFVMEINYCGMWTQEYESIVIKALPWVFVHFGVLFVDSGTGEYKIA